MSAKNSTLLKAVLSVLSFLFTGLDIGVICFMVSISRELKDFPSGFILLIQGLVYAIGTGIILFSTAIIVVSFMFLVHIIRQEKQEKQNNPEKQIKIANKHNK